MNRKAVYALISAVVISSAGAALYEFSASNAKPHLTNYAGGYLSVNVSQTYWGYVNQSVNFTFWITGAQGHDNITVMATPGFFANQEWSKNWTANGTTEPVTVWHVSGSQKGSTLKANFTPGQAGTWRATETAVWTYSNGTTYTAHEYVYFDILGAP